MHKTINNFINALIGAQPRRVQRSGRKKQQEANTKLLEIIEAAYQSQKRNKNIN